MRTQKRESLKIQNLKSAGKPSVFLLPKVSLTNIRQDGGMEFHRRIKGILPQGLVQALLEDAGYQVRPLALKFAGEGRAGEGRGSFAVSRNGRFLIQYRA